MRGTQCLKKSCTFCCDQLETWLQNRKFQMELLAWRPQLDGSLTKFRDVHVWCFWTFGEKAESQQVDFFSFFFHCNKHDTNQEMQRYGNSWKLISLQSCLCKRQSLAQKRDAQSGPKPMVFSWFGTGGRAKPENRGIQKNRNSVFFP